MQRDHLYFVYILASRPQGTLYIGVTNDLVRRVLEHREGKVPGFTKRYAVHRLVYFERHGDIQEAIAREKRLKRWHCDWKRSLIEEDNRYWIDLLPQMLEDGSRIAPTARPG